MIEQIVQEIEQHGFCYLTQVMTAADLAQIQTLFDSEFRPARVGKNDGPKRVEEIRGDWILWLDPQKAPVELISQITFLNELKNKLNQHFYLGLKDFECHLAKYPAGSFYKKHMDRFEKDSSRSVSFIFYLHQEWNEADGGELVLYDKAGEVLKTILPQPGSLVVFMSEQFPHEVKTCQRERRSLTGWMHTKLLT
jgi:SM-20-related protein